MSSFASYSVYKSFNCFFSQTWADAFKGQPELKEVEKQYQDLKKKGIEFPMADLDKMAPIHTPARVCGSWYQLVEFAKAFFSCFLWWQHLFLHWSFNWHSLIKEIRGIVNYKGDGTFKMLQASMVWNKEKI